MIDKTICGNGTCHQGDSGHYCACHVGSTNYGNKGSRCTGKNTGVCSVCSIYKQNIFISVDTIIICVVLLWLSGSTFNETKLPVSSELKCGFFEDMNYLKEVKLHRKQFFITDRYLKLLLPHTLVLFSPNNSPRNFHLILWRSRKISVWSWQEAWRIKYNWKEMTFYRYICT